MPVRCRTARELDRVGQIRHVAGLELVLVKFLKVGPVESSVRFEPPFSAFGQDARNGLIGADSAFVLGFVPIF